MPSKGSITFTVAKELANITCPLVGQSPHHLKNTKHFVQHIQKVKLLPGEVITSYDVKAPFTSGSVNTSISKVQQKLHKDPTLPKALTFPYNKLSQSWSFSSKTHTSSSKVSIMNRSMVLPWVPPLALSLSTCLWKSLMSRPFALPLTSPYG